MPAATRFFFTPPVDPMFLPWAHRVRRVTIDAFIPTLTFAASEAGGSAVLLKWNFTLENLSPLTVAAHYTITSLSSQPALTVVSASFDGTRGVTLHLSGGLQSGNYRIDVAPGTAATVTNLVNAAVSDTFASISAGRRLDFNAGFDG